jgi:hypothetical protein
MSTALRPPTAKIYQFPRRVTTRPASPSASTGQTRVAPSPNEPCVDFGSGWYHEAAIEAERVRKH